MKRNDWILIGVLLILAAAGLGVTKYFHKDQGEKVIVYVDKEEYAVYDLWTDGTYEIETERGSNLLVVKDGKADMEEADCPDRLCVKQKPISKNGETIVCLPHRLVVEIKGGSETEMDGLTR